MAKSTTNQSCKMRTYKTWKRMNRTKKIDKLVARMGDDLTVQTSTVASWVSSWRHDNNIPTR